VATLAAEPEIDGAALFSQRFSDRTRSQPFGGMATAMDEVEEIAGEFRFAKRSP